jgi:hypothetical protein
MLPSLNDGFSNVRRANRRMVVAIGLMVVLWLVVVLARHSIWAHWWGYRLQRADDVSERLHYLGRLAGLGEAGLPIARDLLNSEDIEMRGFGVNLLSRVRTPAAADGLLVAVADPDPDIRRLALQAYGDHTGPDVIATLERLIHDPHPDVAQWAVVCLATRHGPASFPVVISTARGHDDPGVRVQAIEALAMVDAHEAIDTLIECLNDLDTYAGQTVIEQSAARALGSMVPSEATQIPSDSPDGESSRVVGDEAARALRILTGESFGYRAADAEARKNAITAWREWRNAQVELEQQETTPLTGA